ncbi:hypothetical protein BKA70DRAFT_1367872 [Coprinopsis sp. MPI-PUGE-AT-0042]|nr:hypothetical protein BKA70DRAFT_1367872 [Coprinopsis sp. MPI-PUGE-AT-0042]
MNQSNSRSSGPSRRRSRSDATQSTGQPSGADANRIIDQDAALLAQFSALAHSGGLPLSQGFATQPSQYPNIGPAPGFYNNFFHHESMSQPAPLPPFSSLDFPGWGQMESHHPQQQSLGAYAQQAGPSSMASSSTTFIPSQYPASASPEAQVPGSPSETGTSTRLSRGRSRSGTNVEDLTEAERSNLAEEKRRRNTAASARFRIKKKQKAVNLERTVSDLTGRAEELEREVGDLRRENGWLKEIVMLKGTRFAAANQQNRLALSQAAALALGHQSGSSSTAASGSSGQASTSHSQQGNEDEDYEESESSEEEVAPKKSKGKGKSKSSSSKP